MLNLPCLVVNIKCYNTNQVSLVKSLSISSNVYFCPSSIYVSELRGFNILAQHTDPVSQGKFTGSIPAEFFKKFGVAGSLINHSERTLPFSNISFLVRKFKKLHLSSIVCVKSLSEARAVNRLKPDIIAYEPPSLIAGNVSVSKAKPSIIKQCVHSCNMPVIVGAGIKRDEDVRIALELGASGVLVASGIVTAKQPLNTLRGLLRWIK